MRRRLAAMRSLTSAEFVENSELSPCMVTVCRGRGWKDTFFCSTSPHASPTDAAGSNPCCASTTLHTTTTNKNTKCWYDNGSQPRDVIGCGLIKAVWVCITP